MKRSERISIICAGLTLAAQLGAWAETKVEYHPLEIGSYLDVGQVVNSTTTKQVVTEGQNANGDMKLLQHTAVYLNQTTTVNDRLDIKVGVGGLFFYGYPATASASGRVIKFGPGVGQAQFIYKFGDVENPSWLVQGGFFPYKYNPDAKNLGEYLMRSGTYPGYEVTGGWSTINSALYMASGLRVRGNFLDNTLHLDANLFLERDIEPQHDLSPALVLSYQPTPIVDLGAGVQFAHLLAVHPHDIESDQFVYDNDSAFLVGDRPNGQSYTFAGTKVMARAAVNFGALLDNPWIGKEGLKIYTEAAILGVKNYPYYYDDITKRIPIMVGINLPTLGFFDAIAFEYEHRDWDFPNNLSYVIAGEPVYGGADPTSYDPKNPPKAVTDQAHKWSFYAKKQIVQGITVYTQVASDYLRGIEPQTFFFSDETVTSKPSEWYYLFRLEFGI
jgi:hypothetical protein